MTSGLIQGGVNVVAGIDNDPMCQETYERNNPGAKYILADVFELDEKVLEKDIGIEKNDDNMIFIGCSPCQFWSVIRTDKRKSEKSKNLLIEFKRFVDYFNPGYVLVENVPGILRKRQDSGLDHFIEDLESKGYTVSYEIVNMNDYGVPQSRKRFSLVASRVGGGAIFPAKHSRKPVLRDAIMDLPSVRAGDKDASTFEHTVAGLTEKNLRRLEKTPKNGGSWLDWADSDGLSRETYKGTGFKDNYGRMSWDKAAPTITTRFFSISNGRFGHPDQDRAISIREGARIQTFPDDYVFYTSSVSNSAKIIGNAVPPLYAKQLAEAIINSRQG